MKNKIYSHLPAIMFGVLVVSFLAAFYIFAWTEPTATPPGGNVPAPINVGSNLQSKQGTLVLQQQGALPSLETHGQALLATLSGNVGIGTTGPDAKLDVLLSSGPQLRLTHTDGSVYADFRVDSQGNLTIRPGGPAFPVPPYNNIFIGSNAGSSNTGISNVAIGHNALYSNTTGGGNTAVGVETLFRNTGMGCENTAVGFQSLRENTVGCYNAAIGGRTFYYNQTGFYNTAVGIEAGRGASGKSFSNNSLFGYRAGYALSTGSNNILIGFQAGDNLTTGSSNIVIGYNIDAPSATGSNQLNIGNTIYGNLSTGNVGIGTTSPGAKLEVVGQVKITGGGPGVGKVLTSDGTGLASWQVGGGVVGSPCYDLQVDLGPVGSDTARWTECDAGYAVKGVYFVTARASEYSRLQAIRCCR